MSQKGIVYTRDINPSKSSSLLFLKINEGVNIAEAGKTLNHLWEMYMNLERGKVEDLHQTSKNLYTGNLSTQIGYSPKLFECGGVKRKMPMGLGKPWKFNEPAPDGGGPIYDGISLNYSMDVKINHISPDHILVQFTGDNEFTVTRPIIETWRLIKRLALSNGKKELLSIDRFYSGFKRDDRRGWLGFHDGITKVKYDHRSQAILINKNSLNRDDFWTLNGTYLSFLRIAIDLEEWDKLDVPTQELIIGRKKISGCPIIGVNIRGEPVSVRGCPVVGTTEVIENGNELYRDQRYGGEIIRNRNFTKKDNSHVGRNLFLGLTRSGQSQQKIFRQGFHFIDGTENNLVFIVGLNFISYQNTTENLFRSLSYGFGADTDLQTNSVPNLGKYFSVRAAGVFLVPPYNEKEDYPGSSIFYSDEAHRGITLPRKYERTRR